jgi:hypothetical protein
MHLKIKVAAGGLDEIRTINSSGRVMSSIRPPDANTSAIHSTDRFVIRRTNSESRDFSTKEETQGKSRPGE